MVIITFSRNDAAEDTTWYDFAVEILRCRSEASGPSQFQAKRPLNSNNEFGKAKATDSLFQPGRMPWKNFL